MTAVVGAKDRATNQVAAQVVTRTDKPTLHGFIAAHAAPTRPSTPTRGRPTPPSRTRTRRSTTRRWSTSGATRIPTVRVLLEHAEAGTQGHVSQDEPEAP